MKTIRGYFSKYKYKKNGGFADINNEKAWPYECDGLPVDENGEIIGTVFNSEVDWEVNEKDNDFEDEFETIEIGDTVKLNKDATIGDLINNYWQGCQMETINILKWHENDEFVVGSVHNGYVIINGGAVNINVLNINVLKVVKKGTKKMTAEEISKELGYKIEVIGEDK